MGEASQTIRLKFSNIRRASSQNIYLGSFGTNEDRTARAKRLLERVEGHTFNFYDWPISCRVSSTDKTYS